MIDVKLPLRTAYYQLLNGNLIYNAVNVPVSDDVVKLANSAAMVYVLLSSQSGQDTSTFSTFDSKEDILIDIVSRGQTRNSKTVVDTVAGQIVNLVLPVPAANGLPLQSGVQFQNVQKTDDRHLDLQIDSSTTVIRRLITFTQDVRQTNNPGVAPSVSSGIQFPVDNDTPAGLINGVNTIYTTTYKFLTGTVNVYLNGLKQRIGIDYTVSGTNTITFSTAPPTGKNILVDYIGIP